MCNPIHEATKVVSRVGGRQPSTVFGPNLVKRYPPKAASYGHCLFCKTQLPANELSQGHYLCWDCYNTLVTNNQSLTTCFMCDRPLSPQQIKQKIAMPREVQLGFCQNCLAYHWYLAAIVLGITPSNTQNHGQPLYSQLMAQNHSASITGQRFPYVDLNYLPNAGNRPQLPQPDNNLAFDNLGLNNAAQPGYTPVLQQSWASDDDEDIYDIIDV